MKVNLLIRIFVLFASVGAIAASIPLHPEAANSQSVFWGNLPVKTTLKAIQ